ncbi:hypothetical protein M4I32_10185 [Microbacterium sp. LRZ72]|uniref:hypothetical protein n=1 Tax=Microbacterium sp. LRZ72 TaxID=2942481 RepID=UPI0029A2B529|nr:hypothetical protein [Microbacterium sp. LRZ72]MDX2377166.1 hypothetical protein [Microbacterium sp. LRZ72]
MSLEAVAPLHAPSPAEPRRTLRPVSRPVAPPARRRRPRVLYAIIALSGALAIAAAQMGLSIAMTQGVYVEQQLEQRIQDLAYQRQSLTDAVAGLSSPQYLAANAAALGMVINEAPSYLRLSDGAVLGGGSAATVGSSIDAVERGSVPNALVQDTPLVTDPDATIDGARPAPAPPASDAESTGDAPEAAAPPALSDGLPSPVTR